MVSFSSFLKRSKKGIDNSQSHLRDGTENDVKPRHDDPDVVQKVQRRQSKREFFRGILQRTNTRPGLRSSNRDTSQLKSTTVLLPDTSESGKPPSPMNPNKPLPPPPSSEAVEREPPRETPVKLNRIMSPFSISDVHKLFSGAPQFYVRSEGVNSGAPWPSVAFPWNEELEIRDLADHGQIEDEAWGCVTAAQHITRDVRKKTENATEHKRKHKGHYRPQCFERPSMVSYQGLERGTMGYSAALQIGVADALLEERQPNESQETLAGMRHNFLNDKKSGLRLLDDLDIVTRLAELGGSYNEDIIIQTRTNPEMYTELFTKVLDPPTRVTDSEDPYSLHVQIEALLKVLSVDHIWFDFGLVEWRIRLGQILWGTPDEMDIDGSSHDDGVGPSLRYWLLLQILLSCELLIRLDMITKTAERNRSIISEEEVHEFDKSATTCVRWSMIMARRWMENIRVELPQVPVTPEQKPSAGWLASLTGGVTNSSTPEEVPAAIYTTTFSGMHQTRQFQGLIHFARKIDWPRIDILAGKVSEGLLGEDGSTLTPVVGTPLSITSATSSYFEDGSKRPGIRRGLSRQNRISATIQAPGWLSRSYLTGLVLPGEALSHLLISTLLENDDAAVKSLGDEANLYGGFMYSGKSFWSTSCVIGRVLAAGKGASECMGWLSSDVIPKGVKDGWINAEIDPAPQDVDSTPETARIWKKAMIEKDSHVLGDAHGDPSSLFAGDFDLPIADAPSAAAIGVSFLSLDLFAIESPSPSSTPEKEFPTSSSSTSPPAMIHTYSANMRFMVAGLDGGSSQRELDLELKHDVHFVTAHPCVPSPNVNILRAPTSPAFRERGGVNGDVLGGPHEEFAGHPLHKSYQYSRHHLSSILLPRSTSMPNPLTSLHTDSNEVFIIDCTEPSSPTIYSPLLQKQVAASRIPRPVSRPGTSPSTSPISPNFDTAPFTPAISDPSKQPPRPTASALPAHLTGTHINSTSLIATDSSTSLVPSTTDSYDEVRAGTLTRQLAPLRETRKRRFGNDLEMLARAWCAESGFNALISRKGRNCVACSVREARALGWKIVLRFG